MYFLRASLHAFQKPSEGDASENFSEASRSTVATYLGLDKRDGLVHIGKRLLKRM